MVEQVQCRAGAFTGINYSQLTDEDNDSVTLRTRGRLRLETTGFRLALAWLHQDARIHLKHNAQSHYASRARQSHWAVTRPTPACRSVRPLPREGRDTHIDLLGAETNLLSLETQLRGFTTSRGRSRSP